MRDAIRTVIIAGGLLVFVSAALALPKEDDFGSKEVRSPAIDDDDFPPFEDQPAEFSLTSLLTGRVGKFFNDFIQGPLRQFPSTVFKFFSGIIASQPLAKLREEVRNLNISYPK